jgi:hypothetical protein
MLAVSSNPNELVMELAAVDPRGPEPVAAKRRSAHLGDLAAASGASRFVWPSWITRAHFTLLSSNPKVGKTRLGVEIAKRVYFAQPWPDGQPPTFPAGTPTLWICGDRHQEELRDLAREFGLPQEAVRLNALPQEPWGGWDLDNPDNLDLLRELIENERPGLTYIDTVWRATRRRLNREDEVNTIMTPIVSIAQECDAAIVGLMHLSKDMDTLGRRLEGLARGIIKLLRPNPSQPDRRRLEVIGNFKEPPPLGVTLRDGGCEFDSNPPEEPARNPGGRPPEKRGEAMKFIKDSLAHANDRIGNELCAKWEAGGGSGKTFWRSVDDLVDEGAIVTDGGKGTGKQMVLHLSQTAPADHDSW